MVGANGSVYGFEPKESLTLLDFKTASSTHEYLGELSVMLANFLSQIRPLISASSKGVLHEVKNVSTALAEAGRVCKLDGKVVEVGFAAFPARWLRWSNLKWRIRHGILTAFAVDKHPGFAREELSSSLQAAGLRMEFYELDVAPGRLGSIRFPFSSQLRDENLGNSL